jgi:aspartyl-tRNA(Asn)/glutamyl-tRNA(Gln) amidotransferase subunit C
MITKEEIQKLADLARLSLTEGEKESLRKDIDSILEYVGQIKEAGGETAEPWEPAIRNVMREDVPTGKRGEYTEALVSAAPKHERGHIKVKKIL